jgi:hypothetical protein
VLLAIAGRQGALALGELLGRGSSIPRQLAVGVLLLERADVEVDVARRCCVRKPVADDCLDVLDDLRHELSDASEHIRDADAQRLHVLEVLLLVVRSVPSKDFLVTHFASPLPVELGCDQVPDFVQQV